MAFNPVTTTEVNAMRRKAAIASTEKWMDAQIASLESDARRLREQRDRFHEKVLEEQIGETKTLGSLTDHLSWFLNEATNATRNMRLDLAVRHAAELQRSEKE